jgi:RNA polymerase sigma-70 factor (ECF subfamily)
LRLSKEEERSLPDLELLARYKASGEVYYAGLLYQRYTHLVLGLCLKYLKSEEDGKDAAMEIFEHLLAALMKHEVANFKSWLHTLARNHCLMKLRKAEVRRTTAQGLEAIDEKMFMENPEVEHQWEEEEREDRLGHLPSALAQLNPEQRQCVELFYLQEKSYQEVAEATGYSLNQVKSYIQNGKRNLKIILMRA